MPNWCFNDFTITGRKGIVDEVRKFALKGDLFNHINPCPARLKTNVSDMTEEEKNHNLAVYGAEYWYDWQCTNWGTKWDICDVQEMDYYFDDDIDDNGSSFASFSMTFNTAWSPPINAFKTFYDRYSHAIDNLVFSYKEEAMFFYGIFNNGVDVCVSSDANGIHINNNMIEIPEWKIDATIPANADEKFISVLNEGKDKNKIIIN